MKHLELKRPLISAHWLFENLDSKDVIVLDASIPKVTDKALETVQEQIPYARFIDIKHKFSDISAPFPNTYPSAEQFQEQAQLLGINNSSAIVVYDDKGIYSSPRVWWLFKSFGFNNIAVLDGGLPAWKANGFETVSKQTLVTDNGDFQAKENSSLMCFFESMKVFSSKANRNILDARSKNRFLGLEAEPRKGLRSGHIPNSINLPFENLIDEKGKMKSDADLQNIFKSHLSNKNPIVFTCGSGITACILALGAELAGYTDVSVYDGSWTEWGSLT